VDQHQGRPLLSGFVVAGGDSADIGKPDAHVSNSPAAPPVATPAVS
jgi:hypothetical protein